jgi:hypothetical protein
MLIIIGFTAGKAPTTELFTGGTSVEPLMDFTA